MSMREKISEAIWQAEWARAGNSGSRRIQWSDNSEETMDKHRFLADAVLDALMEPTEGMEAAAIQTDEVDSIDWVEALMGTGITSAQAVVVASYKAMIRAAKEGK